MLARTLAQLSLQLELGAHGTPFLNTQFSRVQGKARMHTPQGLDSEVLSSKPEHSPTWSFSHTPGQASRSERTEELTPALHLGISQTIQVPVSR